MKALPTLLDERGALAPGALGILADSGLGHAIATGTGTGTGTGTDEGFIATSHLHLALLAPLDPDHDRYVLEATVDAPAAARGEIRDPDGTCVARASLGGVFLAGPPFGGDRPIVEAAPGALAAERIAPVDELLALDVVEHPSGAMVAHWRTDPSLGNSGGGVHGGFGFLVGARVLDLVAGRANPAARVADVRAVFLRPIAADGASVRVSITTLHGGRRLHAARAVLHDHAGHPAVIVDATHVVN